MSEWRTNYPAVLFELSCSDFSDFTRGFVILHLQVMLSLKSWSKSRYVCTLRLVYVFREVTLLYVFCEIDYPLYFNFRIKSTLADLSSVCATQPSLLHCAQSVVSFTGMLIEHVSVFVERALHTFAAISWATKTHPTRDASKKDPVSATFECWSRSFHTAHPKPIRRRNVALVATKVPKRSC